MKNYMQIELGGKLRGLKFGVMATFEALGTLTPANPLNYRPESDSFEHLSEYGRNLFHAGLLANCSIKDEAPDFTAEDVARWYKDLSLVEITQIIRMHTGEVEKKEGGEAATDTQGNVGGA